MFKSHKKGAKPLAGEGDTKTFSSGASKLALLAVFVHLFQVWAGFTSPLAVTAPEPNSTVPASCAAASSRAVGNRKAFGKFIKSRKADSMERSRKEVKEELTSLMQRTGAQLGT